MLHISFQLKGILCLFSHPYLSSTMARADVVAHYALFFELNKNQFSDLAHEHNRVAADLGYTAPDSTLGLSHRDEHDNVDSVLALRRFGLPRVP